MKRDHKNRGPTAAAVPGAVGFSPIPVHNPNICEKYDSVQQQQQQDYQQGCIGEDTTPFAIASAQHHSEEDQTGLTPAAGSLVRALTGLSLEGRKELVDADTEKVRGDDVT